MRRDQFIKILGMGMLASGNLSSLAKALGGLDGTDHMMPALFIGHGSPMNAILDNDFTRTLLEIGKKLERPKAILCISAHWMSRGTLVNVSEKPKMIYDMGGFPRELYKVNYPAPGSPEFAIMTKSLFDEGIVGEDTKWGFDHGNWSIMKWLFPEADIPLFQMSIDHTKPAQYHYDLGTQLLELRKKGVLIIGSGNITHNLGVFEMDVDAPPAEWASEFDEFTKIAIDKRDHKSLINYQNLGASAKLAIPEPSHWLPLLYTLGLQTQKDEIDYIYTGMQHGTFSMRCFQIVTS